MSSGGKLALLTVGSTEFEQLVDAALGQDTISALESKGYTRFIVQYGRQAKPQLVGQSSLASVEVELHAFMDDIEERMKDADLVLSHAGVCILVLFPIVNEPYSVDIGHDNHMLPVHGFACLPARCWIDTGRSEGSSAVTVIAQRQEEEAAHHRPERYPDGCASV